MTPRPRALLAPAAVAAVVATALSVGDHDDSPSDPSGRQGRAPQQAPQQAAPRIVPAQEFCDGFGALAAAREAQLGAASPEAVQDLKDAADQVSDLAVGTAMPDTARAGVDYVVAAFRRLPLDASAQDVVEADDAATLTDDAHAEALSAWIAESCRATLLSGAK